MYTDSSGGVFGGCWNDKMIQWKFSQKQAGLSFSQKQAGLSINTKELLAIYYTLSAFGAKFKGEVVLLHCNNTVSVFCIKKKGSQDPLRIFHIAKCHNFTMRITWVSGCLNEWADKLSRKLTLNPRTE